MNRPDMEPRAGHESMPPELGRSTGRRELYAEIVFFVSIVATPFVVARTFLILKNRPKK